MDCWLALWLWLVAALQSELSPQMRRLKLIGTKAMLRQTSSVAGQSSGQPLFDSGIYRLSAEGTPLWDGSMAK
jgi:hypothetical protein